MDNSLSIKLYQTIADSNDVRVFTHWHASSIADCPRTHYMKRLGVQPVNKASAAQVLRWTAGHLMEEAIREHLLKIFPDMVSNHRIDSTKLDLTGEYDNFVPSTQTLIEVKTVHDYAFIERDGQTYLKDEDGNLPNGNKKWKIKDSPYLHHEIQNHAYIMLLKEEEQIEVKEIIYVYISLGGRIVVYRTKPQQELINNVTARLEALNESWKTKTPPVCICGNETHPLYKPVMQYCVYKTENGCCDINLIKENK
jgi:CRISPR/Cas system-associated exonuclease Cas4 (RecB family)